MKIYYNHIIAVIIISIFSSLQLYSQISESDFVTTWKTDNPSTLSDRTIRIPTIPGTYNYDIDWDNDGVFDEFGITGNAQHDYDVPGTYTIRIRGVFPRIYINENPATMEKILSVDQWGDIEWSSMASAFRGAVNLVINATDAPDLSNVITMEAMFYEASSMNQNINHWDVSNVRFMDFLFGRASSFNQPLNNWNVSNVEDMHGMFTHATAFNQPLNNWDVSKVDDMAFMFNFASTFNQSLNDWNVGSVITMRKMFNEATLFNQPLDNWNTSSVTDMNNMFFLAINFNQPLNDWDVSNVTDMEGMFNNAQGFNQPLSNWNVSNVTTMKNLFTFTPFDRDIGSWNITSVTDMQNIFQGSELSTENYDSILNGWESQTPESGLQFHGGNSYYCQSEEARNRLINSFGWTITDLGLDCSTLSIVEDTKLDLEIYPNPTDGELFITSLNLNEIQEIHIYDLNGRQIKSIKSRDNHPLNEIDLRDLNSGLYFIAIKGEGFKSVIKKIVLQ